MLASYFKIVDSAALSAMINYDSCKNTVEIIIPAFEGRT